MTVRLAAMTTTEAGEHMCTCRDDGAMHIGEAGVGACRAPGCFCTEFTELDPDHDEETW